MCQPKQCHNSVETIKAHKSQAKENVNTLRKPSFYPQSFSSFSNEDFNKIRTWTMVI